VLFVSPSRKMAEWSIQLGQDGFLFRYLHMIIDYYPDIWPHSPTLVIASLDKLQINHSTIRDVRSSERYAILITERYAKAFDVCVNVHRWYNNINGQLDGKITNFYW
jgi:hypothetical protein